MFHLTEGSRRNLGDLIATQSELLEVARQVAGDLLQLIPLHVQVQQVRNLLEDLGVDPPHAIVGQVDPLEVGGVLEGVGRHLVYVVVPQVEVVDVRRDLRNPTEVAVLAVECVGIDGVAAALARAVVVGGGGV